MGCPWAVPQGWGHVVHVGLWGVYGGHGLTLVCWVGVGCMGDITQQWGHGVYQICVGWGWGGMGSIPLHSHRG